MATWVGYARNYSAGRRRPVQYVVIHYTAGSEGPTSAEAGASYDKRRTDGVSTHCFADSNSVVREVPDTDRAHHARFHGNEIGLGLEICGTAQTRAQWLDAASLPTLRQAAKQTAEWCQLHNLPVRRLSVAETRAAYYAAPAARPRGIVGHVDCTYAYPEDGGTHTDPGAHFPWDVFLQMVREEMGDDDMGWTDKLGPTGSTKRRWPGGGYEDTAAGWVLRAAMYAWDAQQAAQAAAAEDATRDAAVLAAVQALASAGGVEAAPIVTAIREEAAKTRDLVEELQAALAAAEQERDDLRARLAEALNAD